MTPDAASDTNTVLESGINSSNWYLKFSETWHTMSQVLGLKRLQELIQGTCSLSEEPVWLLGLWYGLHNKDSNANTLPEEMQELLLEDFSRKFWFTYRRDFPPIGASGLTSDVGWGCTIRSGQMMMAEALARCWWGRTTRLPAPASSGATAAAESSDDASNAAASQGAAASSAAGPQPLAATGSGSSSAVCDQLLLLRLFLDHPGPAAPFSIHNICRAGAHHGVVAGQWLGPWVLCKALAAAAAAVDQQQPLGLQVHVVCDPGGGAPALQVARMKELFTGSTNGSKRGCQGSSSAACGQQQHVQQQQGLLLLVPLTLGVGKINERYLPQLSAVLTFPQSVGIVGGRPSASLYFLGVQGSAVVYLDPHEAQEVPQLPHDVPSFHCTSPRLMPLTSIDPSLAIGFYCSSTGDLEDLASRLQQLMDSAGGAPLMTVDRGDGQQEQQVQQPAGGGAGQSAAGLGRDEPGSAEDWELV